LRPGPPAVWQVCTQVDPAENTLMKQVLAVALHPPTQDVELAPSVGQVVMQSARDI
jgi:hypothetical protein